MNTYELLKLIANGMLDLTKINQEIPMKERELILSKHIYEIYQGKDGAWYTYIKDSTKKTGRKLIRRVDRTKLEDILIDIYKAKEKDGMVTVREAFDEWNKRKLELGKIKNATFTRHEQVFERYYGILMDRNITEVTPQEFSNFLEEQISKFSLTRKSFANLKALTAGFLKRAKKRGLIFWSVDLMLSELDVSEKEFTKKVKEDYEEIFFDDEISKVMDYCREHTDDRACLGIALMFATGMRVGEIVALEKSDIEGCIVTVSKTETKYKTDAGPVYEVADYPKTPAGIRKVVVPDKYLWILEELTDGVVDGYLITGKHGKRLITQSIRNRLNSICRKLGLLTRSPHKIRKTYGSILLDSGVDSKLIEKQMGHTDIKCTETYYHRDRRDVDQKREILNKIPQFM